MLMMHQWNCIMIRTLRTLLNHALRSNNDEKKKFRHKNKTKLSRRGDTLLEQLNRIWTVVGEDRAEYESANFITRILCR